MSEYMCILTCSNVGSCFAFYDEALEVIPHLCHLFSYHKQYQPVSSTEF